MKHGGVRNLNFDGWISNAKIVRQKAISPVFFRVAGYEHVGLCAQRGRNVDGICRKQAGVQSLNMVRLFTNRTVCLVNNDIIVSEEL